MATKWGIWCGDGWMYDSNHANGYTLTDCVYDSKRAATMDLNASVHKSRRDAYEVRPYRKCSPPKGDDG
jgi:hypothetical protein